MTNGILNFNKLPVPHSSRGQSSLADDSTAVTPPSHSSKQPSEYQVITESCEWCMETAPWTDDEDDTNTIIAATTSKPASPSTSDTKERLADNGANRKIAA
jgi:hypothetical protein